MNILMIASSAPPKNGPEAIQVGRYLQELDKNNKITLVTTPIFNKGWINFDKSLNMKFYNTQRIELKLPFHSFINRVLMSKYLNFLSYPDSDFWILYKENEIINRLISKPQIIYSRSFSISNALLAKKLKERLDIPWVMHLSDPWADNPYHISNNKIQKDELICFQNANAVILTTESMADFYRNKYPQFVQKIYVGYNVMPNKLQKKPQYFYKNNKLKLLYTGTLYGRRRLTTILKALKWMKIHKPKNLKLLEIEIIGNMTDEIKMEIQNSKFEQIKILGKVNYAEVIYKQSQANILISIEPDGKNPLLKTFMPSKILDYIAIKKCILAITPEGSETWKLCEKGFGWLIRPDDYETLGILLNEIVEKYIKGEQLCNVPKLLTKYTSKNAVEKLLIIMENITKKS